MRVKLGVLLCGVLCAGALVLPGAAGAALSFAGPAYSNTDGPPTTSKPESKLWFHDGTWWGSLYSNGQKAYTIHRLNRRTQNWVNTRVVIDGRDTTRQDALSLGNTLFIASHKWEPRKRHQTLPDEDGMKLYRFTYGGSSYTRTGITDLDPGNAQRSEALVIANGPNGTIWATWVQQNGAAGPYQVFLKKTANNCITTGNCTFGPTEVLDTAVGEDDISSIVRFGSNLGIVWSDTPESKMMFSLNGAGGGSEIQTASGHKLAEDHINLKADGGTIYAAVKTKFNRRADRPGIRVLVRRPSGQWIGKEVTNASFRLTRPIVLLEGSRVRVFATQQGSGHTFMKSARKSTLNFPGGGGSRVMSAGDPTSTKQHLNGRTQLVVLGANHDASPRRYQHMYIQLARCLRGNGTAADDRLCGNRRNNRIKGFGGNDVIKGGGGNDTLIGGGGRDRLLGGGGHDTLVARDGARDNVNGGRGRDRARVDRSLDRRRSIERLF